MAKESISKIGIFLDGKQAVSVITDMTNRIKELNAEKAKIESKKMFSPEDILSMQNIDKKIKELNSSIKNIRRQLPDISEVLRDVSKASENDLSRAMRSLIKQTKNLDRSTQEYAENRKKIALIREELDKINESSGKSAQEIVRVDAAIRRLDKQSMSQLSKAAEQLSKDIQQLSPGTDLFIKKSEQLNAVKKRYQELNDIVKQVGKAQPVLLPKDVVQDMGSFSANEIREAINELKRMKDAIPTGEVKSLEEINKQINLLETHLKGSQAPIKLKSTASAIEQIGVKADKASPNLINIEKTIRRLNKQSTGQLNKAISQLNTEISKLTPGTQKYIEKSKQLSIIQSRYDQITGAVKKQTSALDQAGAAIKRWASYALAYAGFNQLTAGLRSMYEMNVALSDQLSDIEKTTGITGRELAGLSDDINRIDTRTSVEQLNNLAAAAGKLGITGKKDVLGFVEAGNMINVALGEDLGEDAIKNIAKLNDVLGITKELGVEKAMLATGSAINELGQSSTASEAYLVDFAQRLGGIAAQAKLTIQQVLALGSASDQMGQNVEVSATALNKLITTIVSKSNQVAKAIGVTNKELQDALNKSTWDALLLVFEKLAGKGGLAAIAPLMGDLGSDGARLTQVISALASNTNKLNEEIEISNKAFAEGTSVVNEYEKKNNNLAGTIEKIGKNIRRWFLGSGVTDWLLKQAKAIETLTRGADTAIEKFEKQQKITNKLTKEIAPLLDEIDRLKDSKSADEQQRLSTIMEQVSSSIPNAVTWMGRYGQILGINTDKAREFIEEQKRTLAFMNKGAISEAEGKLYELEKKRIYLEERMGEISQKGSYTTSRTFQTSTFGTSQTITYEESSIEKIKQQENELKETYIQIQKLKSDIRDLSGESLEDLNEITENATNAAVISAESDEERKKRLKSALDDIDAYVDQEKTKLIQARINKQKYRDEDIDSETKYNSMLEKIQFEALNKKLAIAGLDKDKRAEIERQFHDFKLKLFNVAENKEKQWVESYNKLQEQLGIRSEDKDKRNIARINVLYDTIIQKAKEGVSANYKSQEEINKDIEKFQAEREKAIRGYWAEQDIKSMDESEAKEKSDLRQKFIDRKMDYEEYLRQEAELENQYADAKLLVEGLNEEQLTELRKKQQEIRFQNMKQAYDKEKALQKQYANVIESSLEGLGGAFAQLATGSEDSMEQMRSALIDTLFDTLTQMVDIWLKELDIAAAVNIAMGSAKEVGTKGLLGIATAALVSGAIHGFMQVAKAAIKSALGGKGDVGSGSMGQRVVKSPGFSIGGYSGEGGTHEVAGVVHKEEYVVPAWQMRDPVSFDYVRALETIRQTRTHANPLPRAGYAEGGPVQTFVPPFTTSDPELSNTLKQINNFLHRLDSKQFTTVLNVSRLNDFQNRFSASVARGSRKG